MPVPISSTTIASRSASVISTFLSASSLKRTNACVERVALHVDAHLLERVGKGVATRVLAEHDLRPLPGRRRRPRSPRRSLRSASTPCW